MPPVLDRYSDPGIAFYRPTCPPRRWSGDVKPYEPPKGTGRAAGASPSPQLTLDTISVFPVNLSRISGTGATEYAISNLLSFPYVVRGLSFVSSLGGGPSTNVISGAVRATQGSTAVAASFNSGTPIFSPYSPTEEYAFGAGAGYGDLWLPIDLGPHRLILRTTNTGTASPWCTCVVLISAAADVASAFNQPPPGGTPGGEAFGGGCTRTFRPLIQFPNGEFGPGDPICLDPRCENGRMIDYQGNDLGPCP